MPELLELDFSLAYIAGCLNSAPPRAPGLHLSDLVYASRQIARGKSPYREEITELDRELMEMGHIWEEFSRVPVHRKAAESGLSVSVPVQMEQDGIIANLDGVLYQQGQPVAVQESKFRFASPSDPRDRADWMMQVKGYCYLLRVNQAWMPVCNITTRPPSASSHIYVLTFNLTEIEENWASLLNTKRYLETNYPKFPNR